MNIAVVGAGYVGLVTGNCLAELGHQVICVDNHEEKVQGLKKGKLPVYEPGLEAIFLKNLHEDRIRFTTELTEGIPHVEVMFLALPTPGTPEGAADLSSIFKVADTLGKLLDHYMVVALKSTVPVGTAEHVYDEIAKSGNQPFDVVSNPEFLREGMAVEDFMHPARVVIGSQSERAITLMRDIYTPLTDKAHPLVVMDDRSAEMTKYTANAFLATKITFMNEVANLCEKLGADIDQVHEGLAPDPRIGGRFLAPGIGYGGSCFPKDLKALLHTAQENAYHFRLLSTVMEINEEQRMRFLPRLKSYFEKKLHKKTIGIWGLAFKPNTDDIREAPALDNIPALRAEGALIKAYDPEAMPNSKKALGREGITYCDNMYEAIDGVDALLIFTEWEVFKTPDFDRMRKLMRNKAIFDGRNLFDPQNLQAYGFYYASVGRRTINRKQFNPNWSPNGGNLRASKRLRG